MTRAKTLKCLVATLAGGSSAVLRNLDCFIMAVPEEWLYFINLFGLVSCVPRAPRGSRGLPGDHRKSITPLRASQVPLGSPGLLLLFVFAALPLGLPRFLRVPLVLASLLNF